MSLNDNNFGDSPSRDFVAVELVAEAGRDLLIDNGKWILNGEFSRVGADLIIKGLDGQIVLVRGFFDLSSPPDLLTDGGLVIHGQLAVRLAGPLAPGQVAQVGPQTGSTSPIGKVTELEGKASATRADGTKVELKEGDPVYQNDIIETGEDAAVGLEFADESSFSLGDSGRMVLDEMVYEPGGDENSMSVSLVTGAFTFVSGQISKADPDAMALKTPVATIGIRGTTLAGKIGGEGEENTFSLLADAGWHGRRSRNDKRWWRCCSQPSWRNSWLDEHEPGASSTNYSLASAAFYSIWQGFIG